MSGITVVRLRNPAALDLPVIQDLFEEALGFIENAPSADDVMDWCRQFCARDYVGVFLARNSASFKGMAIVDTARDLWSPAARVSLLWAPSAPPARDALVDAIIEFCLGRGVSVGWGVNQSHLDDSEYMEKLNRRGTASVLGSLVEFNWGEAEVSSDGEHQQE